jgi:hypothetical protein
MKCVECNKYFKSVRKDAKCCSKRCRTRRSRRKKEEAVLDKKEQKLSLGKVKELQKKKMLNLDRQIQFIKQKIKGFQVEFKDLKEQEEIALIEMRTIREVVKENQGEIQQLRTILTLNDKKFYTLYCNNVETKMDDWGLILNGIANFCLMESNQEERNKEIKRMKTKITNELIELKEVLNEDNIFLKELYQKLMAIREKLKKLRKTILVGIEKIKALEKQKLMVVKSVLPQKIQRSTPVRNNGNVKNGVGGADLQNMTFNTFVLDSELGRFLGELDKNKTAFALTGDSGAGKSYFSFELAKVFIDNGFCAKYFALEEGLGKLTQNKVRFYDLGNDITITGNGTLRDVRRDAKKYDLIVIDSFQKLNVKAEEFERLRQDFPKTIFIIIFQKTSSGAMRGGSSIKFNSSATIDVQIKDNERIAFMEKGRYGTIGWVYSIDEGRIIMEN